jgi:hypothetical protein
MATFRTIILSSIDGVAPPGEKLTGGTTSVNFGGHSVTELSDVSVAGGGKISDLSVYNALHDANAQLSALHTDGSPQFVDITLPNGSVNNHIGSTSNPHGTGLSGLSDYTTPNGQYINIESDGTIDGGINFTRGGTTDASIYLDSNEDLILHYMQSDLANRNLYIKRGSSGVSILNASSSGNINIYNELSEQGNRVATRNWSTLQNVTEQGNETTYQINTVRNQNTWGFQTRTNGSNYSGFYNVNGNWRVLARDVDGNLNIDLRSNGTSYFRGGNVNITDGNLQVDGAGYSTFAGDVDVNNSSYNIITSNSSGGWVRGLMLEDTSHNKLSGIGYYMSGAEVGYIFLSYNGIYDEGEINITQDKVGINIRYPSEALDVDGNFQLSGNEIMTGGYIGSDNYTIETTGWRMTYSGELDVRSIFTDELIAKTFIADVDLALLSGHIVSKSVTQLSRDFTVPSNGNTGSLYVECLPGHPTSWTFEVGDWIRLQVIDRSGGGLTWSEVWVTVTSQDDINGAGTTNTGEQVYTVTTQDAGAGGTVRGGAAAQDYGQSGDGFIEQQAGYDSNTPYLKIATWTTDPSANETIRTQIGNLNNITNATGYGLYSANAYLTNSILVGDLTETANFMKFDGSLNINATAFDLNAGSGNLKINSTDELLSINGNAVEIGNLNNGGYSVNAYGLAAGDPSGDNIVVDGTNGMRFRNGTNVAASFTNDAIAIVDTRGTSYGAGISKADSAHDYVSIWAGDSASNRANAPFKVFADGVISVRNSTDTADLFSVVPHTDYGFIGGAKFTDTSMFTSGGTSSGGLLINWAQSFQMRMFDGGGSIKVDYDFTSTTLNQQYRNQSSGTNAGTLISMNVDSYDKIDGTLTVANNSGSVSDSVDIVYEYYDGSWNEIDRYTHSGKQDVTRSFSFNGLVASQFRIYLIENTGDWSISSYDMQQYLSQLRVTQKGVGFLAANLILKNQPVDPNLESMSGMDDGTLYLQSDGSGHYNVKVK